MDQLIKICKNEEIFGGEKHVSVPLQNTIKKKK